MHTAAFACDPECGWTLAKSAPNRRLARSIARDLDSGVAFVRADYNHLPFPEAHFDRAVFPQNIVECSYGEIDRLAASIRRALRPGGRFYVLLSSDTDLGVLGQMIEEAGFAARQVGERSIMIESFIIYELAAD